MCTNHKSNLKYHMVYKSHIYAHHDKLDVDSLLAMYSYR